MSYVDLLSNKIKCGKCGRMFSRYTWHSTSYNDKVWQCRSKMKRNGYCKNIHIYDDILQRSILVLPNGPLPNLAENKAFLFLNLENLSFIIERIIANADNFLTFQFLDGSSCNIELQSRSLIKIAVTSAILTIGFIAEKYVDSWRISVLTLWRLSGEGVRPSLCPPSFCHQLPDAFLSVHKKSHYLSLYIYNSQRGDVLWQSRFGMKSFQRTFYYFMMSKCLFA